MKRKNERERGVNIRHVPSLACSQVVFAFSFFICLPLLPCKARNGRKSAKIAKLPPTPVPCCQNSNGPTKINSGGLLSPNELALEKVRDNRRMYLENVKSIKRKIRRGTWRGFVAVWEGDGQPLGSEGSPEMPRPSEGERWCLESLCTVPCLGVPMPS